MSALPHPIPLRPHLTPSLTTVSPQIATAHEVELDLQQQLRATKQQEIALDRNLRFCRFHITRMQNVQARLARLHATVARAASGMGFRQSFIMRWSHIKKCCCRDVLKIKHTFLVKYERHVC